MKCICCHDWEFEELPEEWETCPNCDFPVKYTDWITNLQDKSKHLENILAIISDDEVIAHRLYTYVTYYELISLSGWNKEEISRNEKEYINNLPNNNFPEKR